MKRSSQNESQDGKKSRGDDEPLSFEDELIMMQEEILDGDDPQIELTNEQLWRRPTIPDDFHASKNNLAHFNLPEYFQNKQRFFQ